MVNPRLNIFKNHNNRLTQERINPLSKAIETNALILKDNPSTPEDKDFSLRSENFLSNRNLYHPLYFMFPPKEEEYSKEDKKLIEITTTMISSNKIEIRVCSDKDKVEKFFNKPTVLSFGYTSELHNKEKQTFIRFHSKGIPIFPNFKAKINTIRFDIKTGKKTSIITKLKLETWDHKMFQKMTLIKLCKKLLKY